MRQKIKIISTTIIIFLFPILVSAQSALDKLNTVGKSGGFNTDSDTGDGTLLATILGKIVQAFLGILGVIFIILILLAGFNWMTAAGEEEKVNKAKDTLRRAVIGLIIIISSWGIWTFISYYILGDEFTSG
jgi:cytochrome bd-type quinol oxidase subunit 2